MSSSTNFEELIKIVGFLSAGYLFLQVFLPLIQNLIAQGLAGFILVVIMIWWLAQKN